MKITYHDKKILLILLGFLLLIVVYFNIYKKQIALRDRIDIEVLQMQTKLAELKDMDQRKEEYLAEIEKIRKEVKKYSDMMPVQIKEEDSIMFARNMELAADLTIRAVGIGELELLSSTAENQAHAASAATPGENPLVGDEGKAVDEALYGDEAAMKEGGDAYIMEERLLYRNVTSLEYQSTYAGLKSAIRFIGDSPDRTTIASLNATYDTGTGNLSGSFLVNQYSMSGIDKPYEEPEVPSMPIGTDNIFGTAEIPVTETPMP
ncbi:MAG: hypothetical protein RR593_03870 [Hungatella sp.]